MHSGSRVVVIVPALDEAPRIARVLRGMPPIVDHVLVIDDASRDGTAEAARAVRDPRVHVVSNAKTGGVGAAIVRGYRIALTLTPGPRDALVVMAGDGQMDPRDLELLLAPITRGAADYVKGERFSWPGAYKTIPPARLVGGLLFSWLTSRAIARPIRDSQCGYTAITRSACVALDFDDLWPGFGYPNDLLAQLAIRRLRIAHVPVRPVYADEVSRLRLRHLAGILRLVLRAWRRRREAERAGPQRERQAPKVDVCVVPAPPSVPRGATARTSSSAPP